MGFAKVSLVATLGVVVELKHFALIIAIVAMVAAICLGFSCGELGIGWFDLLCFDVSVVCSAEGSEIRWDSMVGLEWGVWEI